MFYDLAPTACNIKGPGVSEEQIVFVKALLIVLSLIDVFRIQQSVTLLSVSYNSEHERVRWNIELISVCLFILFSLASNNVLKIGHMQVRYRFYLFKILVMHFPF